MSRKPRTSPPTITSMSIEPREGDFISFSMFDQKVHLSAAAVAALVADAVKLSVRYSGGGPFLAEIEQIVSRLRAEGIKLDRFNVDSK